MNLNNSKTSEKKTHHYYTMALRKERRKRIANPDGYGRQTGKCGDTVEIFLMADNDHIDKIFFETNGCLSTSACANAVAFLSEGRKIADAWEITPEHIVNYLEVLPSEEVHCAELVAGTFYLALSNCRQNKLSPWKRVYQIQKT